MSFPQLVQTIFPEDCACVPAERGVPQWAHHLLPTGMDRPQRGQFMTISCRPHWHEVLWTFLEEATRQQVHRAEKSLLRIPLPCAVVPHLISVLFVRQISQVLEPEGDIEHGVGGRTNVFPLSDIRHAARIMDSPNAALRDPLLSCSVLGQMGHSPQ